MLVLRRLQRWCKDDAFVRPSFSIICITGFVFVTVFAGILSLWMALGDWIPQLIIIMPCIVVFFQKGNPSFFKELKNQFAGLHRAVLLLFVLSVIMILVMSTWTINHPDTLAYHAQTIHWIEKYRVIPGLVHLNSRYGYQGQWFVACALFSFRFTGTDALTLINSTILLWYLLFVIQQINKSLSISGHRVNTLLWLSLFIVSCLSYTQVRLTATSASPDFIAALLIWTVFYLFLKKALNSSPVQSLLVILLSIFAITIKLSAIPVLLVGAFAFFQLLRVKKIRAIIVSLMLTALILFPFLIRNTITTGYLLFPSSFPDIVNVDWKFSRSGVAFEKKYITAYARTPVEYAKPDVETVIGMSPGEWVPRWWRNIGAIDKIIVIALVLCIIAAIASAGAFLRSSIETKAALIAAITGIIFWFVEAPDPRFGFGFFFPLAAIILSVLLSRSKMISGLPEKPVIIAVLLFSLVTGGYTGYRFLHFFSSKQLLVPMGIVKNQSTSFRCNDVLFYKPADSGLCGDLPLPCVYTDSCDFILRGADITDGFRAKTTEGK